MDGTTRDRADAQPLTNGLVKYSPTFGRRLLPQVLDEHARRKPDRLYAAIPRSTDISQGYRDISCHDMANAVNGVARWLGSKVGHSDKVETLAYMGIADLRITILFLGAMKCGYKSLLLSPRNPLAANLSLLEQTKCTKFCFPTELHPLVHRILQTQKALCCFEIPSLNEILDLKSEEYPYDYSFDEVSKREILILHSSGSTGLPKPITMTHGTFATMDNDRNLPNVEGRKRLDFTIWDFSGGGKFYTAFPPFHLAGVVATAIVPIFSEACAVVLGPGSRPATGALVKDIMQYHSLRALFVPPSIIEQLLQEPEGVDELTKLDWLAYTGGPLSPSAGDIASKVVDICQYFGITETLPLQQLVPARQDWAYIEWNPCRKIELQPSDDEAYELVVLRDDSTEHISGLDHNYPGVSQWHTKDLFRPHPTIPRLWRFHGRKDDIIVLSNGEKFNPVPMEALLHGHSLIAGALVVGQGQVQAALLLEPKQDTISSKSLIREIWPFVEQANCLVPGHGQITRSNIIIASPGKPFQRAGKGTIVRRLTEQSYSIEIERLYELSNQASHEKIPKLSASPDLLAVRQFLAACVRSSCLETEINDDEDIFVLGVDSLKAVTIAAILKVGLRSHRDNLELAWLSDKTLYEYPRITQLSEKIYRFLIAGESHDEGSNGEPASRTTRMAVLVEKYTQNLWQRSTHKSLPPKTTEISVALTGSTGALGRHLLQALLDSPNISHIYCLNRSPDARERHLTICTQHGTSPPSDNKVTYMHVDFSKDNLGLSPAVLDDLQTKVDTILHNAWKVDFKHTLRSYEAVHLRGLRQLIDLSLRSARSPRIIFISSASVAGNWIPLHRALNLPAPPVPESILQHPAAAQQTGYAESKLVAEYILDGAAKRARLPVTVLRVGQIAGSTRERDAAWPAQEWIPSVIQTAKAMGVLPRELGPVDWIPVDRLAGVVAEIVRGDFRGGEEGEGEGARVYNLTNPRVTHWGELLPTLQTHLALPGTEAIIPLKEWVQRLETYDRSDVNQLVQKPALKLLELLKGIEAGDGELRFETGRAREGSGGMRGLERVGEVWMGGWLRQWGF